MSKVGKVLAALLIGIGVGIGVAYWQGTGGERIGAGLPFEDRALLERRFSELERSLALERHERQALADELASLTDSIGALPARALGDDESRGDARPGRKTSSSDGDGIDPLAGRTRDPFADGVSPRREEIEQVMHRQQVDRFVAAGIAPAHAEEIMQREEEVEMQALRARYAATQSGATAREVASITPLALLRSELGDAEYAKYLEARGRPSSISVREVLARSPGEIAGLKPGDEIVAYNGQRVFNTNELSALTHQAGEGTTVPLQVLRDGQPVQVYVEAGPIGISASYRRPPASFE